MHVEMKRIYFGLSCNSRLDRAQVFSRLDRAQEVTLAIFHISGKTSILNEELNILLHLQTVLKFYHNPKISCISVFLISFFIRSEVLG